MSFKSGVKSRRSDKRWQRRWRLWWGGGRIMRWTKRGEQDEVDETKKVR